MQVDGWVSTTPHGVKVGIVSVHMLQQLAYKNKASSSLTIYSEGSGLVEESNLWS